MGRQMLRGVYPERSEGLSMALPVLVVKVHNQALHFTRKDASFGVRFLSVGISTPLILLVESEKYTCNNPQV